MGLDLTILHVVKWKCRCRCGHLMTPIGTNFFVLQNAQKSLHFFGMG